MRLAFAHTHLICEAPSEPQSANPRAAEQRDVVVGDRSPRRRRSGQAGEAGRGQEHEGLCYRVVVGAVRQKVFAWVRFRAGHGFSKRAGWLGEQIGSHDKVSRVIQQDGGAPYLVHGSPDLRLFRRARFDQPTCVYPGHCLAGLPACTLRFLPFCV